MTSGLASRGSHLLAEGVSSEAAMGGFGLLILSWNLFALWQLQMAMEVL